MRPGAGPPSDTGSNIGLREDDMMPSDKRIAIANTVVLAEMMVPGEEAGVALPAAVIAQRFYGAAFEHGLGGRYVPGLSKLEDGVMGRQGETS